MVESRGLTERAPAHRRADGSAERIATGLHKISLVLRQAAWREGGERGLTPTQAQLLTQLAPSTRGRTLAGLAAELGVTAATASDSLSALERKGLVAKRRARDDGRALAVTLTPSGRRLAGRLALWPDFLLGALGELDADERDVFQRALVKMIRSLQEEGRIPVARMCVGCQFFRPYAHADDREPHHCAFVDAPFGDRELRIDCADQLPLPPDDADALWREFVASTATTRSRKETR